MRQILLASTLASAGAVSSGSAGNVGFAYNNSGVPTFTLTASDLKKEAYLILKRAAANMGDVVLPFFKNNFSYSKMTYSVGTKFKDTIAFGGLTITPGYDYTVIFTKKGVKFNERSKWTFTERASDTLTTAQLATKVAAFVNNNVKLGLTATVSSNTSVIVEAKEYNVDYKVVPTDSAATATVTHTATYAASRADAEMVKGFAEKAAADAGFEYTYQIPNIYPKLNGSGVDVSAYASGATIYTIRFNEPRDVKTRDEVVNQIVQIVLPANVTVTSFDTLLAALV